MATVLKIGGVTINRDAAGLGAFRLTAYSARGRSSFEFLARNLALLAGPDVYLGQTVELWIDDTLRFAGDVDDVSEPFDSFCGWVQRYRCTDLRGRADRVPVTDPTTGIDEITFNLSSEDLDYRGQRAGRTLGYILKYAIETPATASRLDALGIGGFSSFGWGADATTTVGGGGVTVTVTQGGSGYSAAPAVVLVGGDGTYTAATATVSGGEVTAISVTGDTGWTVAPEVWIGTLPLVTLKELSALAFVSPSPVSIAGDMILAAVDGLLRNQEPNVVCHVEPNGTLRFRDLREFAAPRVVIDGDGTGATARARTDATGAVTAVDVLTGGTDYTTATARVTGGGGLGATLSVTLGSGAVTAIGVSTGGIGYRYPRELELGTDPIEPFSLQRDIRGCYTRVVVRGQPDAEMVELRLSRGDLEEDFAHDSLTNTQAKEAWSLNDFEGGGADGRDLGTVTSCTSTTVTVESDDATRTWAANHWDQTNRKGNVFLKDNVLTNVEAYATRAIVSNTALSAGGTSVLTLDRPLPGTGYDLYTITGTAGGAADVWRQYAVTNAAIAQAMLSYASRPLPIRSAAGSAASLSSTPMIIVQYSESGSAPYMEMPMGVTVDPDAGTILADKPVVCLFGNRSDLLDGGFPLDGDPADVILYVPVNKGALSVTFPPDAADSSETHVGDAHTDYDLARTLVVTVPGLRDPGQLESMREYARAMLDSVCDVSVEGSLVYRGLYTPALSLGLAVNLSGRGYVTGWEAAELPIVECEIVWEETGPDLYTTRLSLSNRRAPYSAMNFLQPEPMGWAVGSDLEGLNAGGLSAGVLFAGGTPGNQFIDPADWSKTAAEMGVGMAFFHREARNPRRTSAPRLGEPYKVTPGAVERLADFTKSQQAKADLDPFLPDVSTPETRKVTPSPVQILAERRRREQEEEEALFGGGG